MELASGIANLHGGLKRVSGKKIFQGCGVGQSHAAQERNAAPGVTESAAIDVVAVNFAADFQRVLARGVRNMVDELSDGIRPLEFWPLEATQARNESSGKANARQPSGEWSAHARVETVA